MKKFTGFNHYFNEPLGRITVGSILRRPNGRSKNFVVATNLFRLIQNKREDYVNIGNKQHHFYYTQTSINVNLGANAGNSLNNTEASISFANKNNAVIVIKDGITTDLYIDELQDDLENIWFKKGYNKDSKNVFLVSSVIVTNKAKVFYSTQNKTSVKLRHKNNLPIIDDLDLINAEFALGREVKSVRMMDIHNKCTVLFKLVRWQNKKEQFVAF